MNTKNFLIGGIVGGVVFFLLGYLFYGVLLTDFFHNHPGTATNVDREMDQFQWWALILGNLLFGFFLAYVFTKAGVATLTPGLITGGILGFLVSASIDLIMYGTTNISSKQMMAADIATTTVMAAIAGAVVGAVIGMLNRTPTVTSTNV
jgi:hypothetical protein